jgi:hypothetical protein
MPKGLSAARKFGHEGEELGKIARFTEKLLKMVDTVETAGRGGLESLQTVLRSQMGKIIEAAEKRAVKAKSAKSANKLTARFADGKEIELVQNLEEAKKAGKIVSFAKGAGNIVFKTGKFAAKHPALTALVVGGGLAVYEHEASDTYEEAKLECQETCQGFNKVNLSQHKYDQIVNFLYCREKDNHSQPCQSFIGGGPTTGEIQLNPCPADSCFDIRQQGAPSSEDTHINSMLYGSCNIKDVNRFYCDYPTYKDNEDTTTPFGIIPLGDAADPNTLDSQFKDPWHGYAAMTAAAIVEAGAAGAVAGSAASLTSTGQMIDQMPVPGGLAGASGAAVAALTNAFIPDDFPGHCLHKIFEHSTNEDPNNFFTNSDDIGVGDGGYKYIRRCNDNQGSETSFAPNAGDVRKCELATGQVQEAGGVSTDTETYGTCVAWKKKSHGNGKCLPTMHSRSVDTTGDEIGSALGITQDCLHIAGEADCNDHNYCYWTEDKDNDPSNLENIYFCLNDKSLIDIHNGILDNEDDLFLINETYTNPNVPVTGEVGETRSIKKFNSYSTSELDISDICNNYCINSLCHEPYISLPLIPGVNNALDFLEIFVNIVLKVIISLFIGLICWFGTSNIFASQFGLRVGFSWTMVITVSAVLNFNSTASDVFDELFQPITPIIVDEITAII